ncbi:hypothetical protein Ancab_012895 [Ancistrocladus abbreviatus]
MPPTIEPNKWSPLSCALLTFNLHETSGRSVRIGPLSAICLLTADDVQLDQLINQVKLLNLAVGGDYATIEGDHATNVLNNATVDEHPAEK